ncbi:unnamed protein product [Lepeophtheirus salmonis]|uniref:(salmon louse) hypothetical protein n=1 Tax=Lepeophtheirus salmonis TaxID=72036 RepID=A0A7R8D2G9_LEPSM|nr:unnamed protein product [Lepeophtheirus salmonis]CAF3005163.1 unnamed protein product [Lepeophtheirus salmonis]
MERGKSTTRKQFQEYVTAVFSPKALSFPPPTSTITPPRGSQPSARPQINNYSATTSFKVAKEHVSNNVDSGVKLYLKDIQQTETFNCSEEEPYNVLTQKSYYQAYFESEIKMNDVALLEFNSVSLMGIFWEIF